MQQQPDVPKKWVHSEIVSRDVAHDHAKATRFGHLTSARIKREVGEAGSVVVGEPTIVRYEPMTTGKDGDLVFTRDAPHGSPVRAYEQTWEATIEPARAPVAP